MDAVKEYLVSAIIAMCAAGIIGMLAPENGSGKYLRYIVSICLLASLLVPLRSVFEMLSSLSWEKIDEDISRELEEITGKTNEIIKEKSSELLVDAIKTKLREDMGIPPFECEIILDTKEEAGEVSIQRITVILSGQSMWKDAKEIKLYIEGLSGCECEVLMG